MSTLKKSVNERALLISFKISQWSGRKIDRVISHEINSSHSASSDAGRYVKNFVDQRDLKDIQRTVNAIRSYINRYTLAWGENGERLLSTDLYFKFTTDLASLKDELNMN